jgi:hypothetical protein
MANKLHLRGGSKVHPECSITSYGKEQCRISSANAWLNINHVETSGDTHTASTASSPIRRHATGVRDDNTDREMIQAYLS